MPRSTRSSSPSVNDPTTLPESTRDYYRSTWGFDPVADCYALSNGHFRFEEAFPLPQDLPLQAVGVTACARVEWEGEEIHNRIVFRRTDDKGRRRKASVECTHTVVYAGPARDALAFADDIETATMMPRAERGRLIRTAKLVILSPWEHFAALKSYVAAVADMGVITLLRQSFAASTGTEDGLPFGFNAEMQEQVARALRAIAPRAMASTYRDLTCEFLDSHPPTDLIDQWMSQSVLFEGKSKRKYWGLLLRHLDRPTLVHWFRHTKRADKLQDRLFTKHALLEKAQAIAPNLPWDTLRLEWEARKEAQRFDWVTLDFGPPDLKHIPPAEIWARTPFCDFAFPRDILSPDSVIARRSRVQTYLREMVETYTERDPTEALGDHFLDAAKQVSAHLDNHLTTPFPADRVRTDPIPHYDDKLKQNLALTLAEVVDRIEHGDHRLRRDAVLCHPIPLEMQGRLTSHWDFATRLALIGNPSTVPAIITILARDPQHCVRLAAEARVRRGTTSLVPLFGEMLDPGEIIWLLSSHPGFFFEFGVTSWGDGSDAYRDWFLAQVREDKRRRYSIGQLYSWVYSEGIFLQDGERGPHGSHLAFYGLTDYACGQLPCLFLGFNIFNPEYGDIRRLDF